MILDQMRASKLYETMKINRQQSVKETFTRGLMVDNRREEEEH